ncbi:MAG: excinuclease ABC subunit C, partial [Candidatus Doudnabacteria bacterium]|nr:excinuclease ABC subunit C [Candidatus Doudnabacteria bacterium]
PQRGKAHQLIKLGQVNAEEYLRKSLATDATDSDKLLEALQQLQELLKLPKLPKRIECYDMSNTQGTNPVGSMVVFIDGKPAKSEYRKFKIRSKDTPDDFAMMRETISRRLGRLENYESGIMNHGQPWPTPDLIVIDGGKGQLSAALEAQEEVMRLQVTGESKNLNSNLKPTTSHLPTIPMVGLAKRIEEIFLPHNPEPIVLSHDHPSLQLLQRLRDEAHRFGITFHRSLRSKQATKSALDTIPGIGPKTKKLLKQKFGTVSAIKNISLEELAKVVGNAKAVVIKENL